MKKQNEAIISIKRADNRLEIRFAYDARIVSAVKSIPNRKYHLEERYWSIPYTPDPLPLVLNLREVGDIISSISNIKHRLAILLIYSAGLRVSEAVNLELKDIDYERKIITIRRGKGKKDRQVPLSAKLEKLLAEYFSELNPGHYLFEGQTGGKY